MSKFKDLLIESLLETQNLEEGKFGKFLGTMATAAALGLGGMQANPAMAGSYQPNHQEQVLRTKFAANVPSWVEDAGQLSTNDGKLFFTAEIVRGPNSNNTAQLERVAQLEASAQLFQTLSQSVNANITPNMKKVGNSFAISGLRPSKSFWLLLNTDDGEEYHAYSQVQIKKPEVIKALTTALQKANPNTKPQIINQIVQNSIQSIMAN